MTTTTESQERSRAEFEALDKLEAIAERVAARGLYNAACDLREYIADARAGLAAMAGQDAKTIAEIQAARIKRLEEQQNAHRPDFLLNGTRFKLNFSTRGNVDVFHNYAAELQGRWVALVPAEDDCHLAAPTAAAVPSYPAVKLTRDTMGMCEVSLELNGKWVSVLRDNGDFISHIVEPIGIADAVAKSALTCKTCGADRSKERCKAEHWQRCPMAGEALTAATPEQSDTTGGKA